MSKKPKPIGSGVFALAAGVLFLVALVCSFFFDLRNIDPYVFFRIWLLFAATILTVWGAVRVAKVLTAVGAAKTVEEGDEPRWEVGQATLNFVVGIIAATAAILALIVH